jgi:hypothetical protein
MKGRCFNALVVWALVSGVAVAGGAPGQLPGSGPSSPGTRASVVTPNIDSCVGRLDPQLDIGYDRVAARCPELMRQLEAGDWAPWLPRGWKESGNDLSAGSLREFRELVDRESAARDSTAIVAPDVRHLQPILAALAGSRNENSWSRFKSWLRSVLERPEQPTDESWLSRMVSHVGVSQSVIRLITYGALAAVVLLAAVIVVNEARTAGLVPKRRGAARTRRELAAAGRLGTSWGDIERAQLLDRPRLLLQLVLRRLSERGFLPPAGALTVRELSRAARLPEADDRSRLTDLAFAAERVRYSATESVSVGLDGPIAGGRELLDRLDGNAVDRLPEGAAGHSDVGVRG